MGVPHRAFARIPTTMVAAWRDRAAAEAPSHLRGHPHQIKVCLLGALLFSSNTNPYGDIRLNMGNRLALGS